MERYPSTEANEIELTKKIKIAFTAIQYSCSKCGKLGFLVARGKRNLCVDCYKEYAQEKLDKAWII